MLKFSQALGDAVKLAESPGLITEFTMLNKTIARNQFRKMWFYNFDCSLKFS